MYTVKVYIFEGVNSPGIGKKVNSVKIYIPSEIRDGHSIMYTVETNSSCVILTYAVSLSSIMATAFAID